MSGRPRWHRREVRRGDIHVLRRAGQHRGGHRGHRAGVRRVPEAARRRPRHLHRAREAAAFDRQDAEQDQVVSGHQYVFNKSITSVLVYSIQPA